MVFIMIIATLYFDTVHYFNTIYHNPNPNVFDDCTIMKFNTIGIIEYATNQLNSKSKLLRERKKVRANNRKSN